MCVRDLFLVVKQLKPLKIAVAADRPETEIQLIINLILGAGDGAFGEIDFRLGDSAARSAHGGRLACLRHAPDAAVRGRGRHRRMLPFSASTLNKRERILICRHSFRLSA